jgi:hypothetical protein
VLHYFGLVSAPDRRFEQPSRPAPPRPEPKPETASEPSDLTVALRKAAVYFGLADDPERSRYGSDVERALDDDIDALRARVAELERRLDSERSARPDA